MSSRKNMKFPIIITFIIIVVIVYLFVSLKQTKIVCDKDYSYDFGVRLSENVETKLDGKKITEITVTKKIVLPEKYADEKHLEQIRNDLDHTLSYLKDKVKYTVSTDQIIVKIAVEKDEIVLLSNIDFIVSSDLQIVINSNTKSSKVVPLTIGDSYTDGEYMQRMKKEGYHCK